jgi:hypothetical protein
MPQPKPLQRVVDPFVNAFGGRVISEIIGNQNPQRSADYLFRQSGVIAELKALQVGSFVAGFHRKLEDLFGKWDREGRVRVFGSTAMSSDRLPPDCREEMFDAMAEGLLKHIVAAANSQIKSTKAILEMPNAKGLLWVASDGNEDLQPNVVWYLLTRILQKKRQNGALGYSSIHGLVYFAPRMVAQIPKTPLPAVMWFSGTRTPDAQLKAWLGELSEAWRKYVAHANGIVIRDINGRPEDARFFGVSPTLPSISVNYRK